MLCLTHLGASDAVDPNFMGADFNLQRTDGWIAGPQAYSLTITDAQTGEMRKITPVEKPSQHAGDNNTCVRTYDRTDLPLRITITESSGGGLLAAKYGATISNTGSQPVFIEEVAILRLALARPLSDMVGAYGFERLPQEQFPQWFGLHAFEAAAGEVAFETGRYKSATWLALRQTSADKGLIIGWATDTPTQCKMAGPHVEVTMKPSTFLTPGETMVLPDYYVCTYDGDFDDGCFKMHRFVEQNVAWPLPDNNFPYLMFNSWGYGTAIDDPLARKGIDLCSKLGVEVFVVDFGWEDPDWLPRKDIFPNGLAPLSDLSHQNNMKFGVHLSYANVSEHAQMYKDHPDWVYGEGCWAYGHGEHAVYRLSLGIPEARQWIVDKVVDVIDREKIDWFLTDTFLWGHIDPEKHELPGDQNYIATQAFEKSIDEIRQRRPNVLIEHCDGGLGLPNYKMMAQHVTSITCDNAQAIDTRLSVYDLSYFLPPRYLDKYQQEWRSHYANRSCMFGGPWILMMPIHTLEPGSRDWNELLEDIAVYKKYRARIRDGKVLHLLRPDNPKNEQWDGWDAIGSYNPTEDAAIVFVFRTRTGPATRTIPMKALAPDHSYQVTYLDEARTYKATGEEINTKGFDLSLEPYETDPNSHCSEIIIIEPAARLASQQ